jgi:hypothetical protein
MHACQAPAGTGPAGLVFASSPDIACYMLHCVLLLDTNEVTGKMRAEV